MPVHDWSRVEDGIYHHFHNAWIIHLSESLNAGVLPPGYSALSDQRVSLTEPDIIATSFAPEDPAVSNGSGAVAVAVSPRVIMRVEAEPARRLRRRRRVVVRRDNDEHVVAIIEIVSPGNKSGKAKVRSLAEKIASYLEAGVHVLLVDLFPPTGSDPFGIQGAVWEYFGRRRYKPSMEEPLSLVSYRWAESGTKAQIEPCAVGRLLPDMPLFLTPDFSVGTPLESSYMQAFNGMGSRYRTAIDEAAASSDRV